MRFVKKNFEMMLARQRKGFTQEDLAKLVESKANYISKIESNIVVPSFDMKHRIAKALDEDVGKLFPEGSEDLGQ